MQLIKDFFDFGVLFQIGDTFAEKGLNGSPFLVRLLLQAIVSFIILFRLLFRTFAGLSIRLWWFARIAGLESI